MTGELLPSRYQGQTVMQVRHKTAREVLDLHADLHRAFTNPEPLLEDAG